ncbi:MAG: glycosyltransferase family 1 protein [Proteobacteria bacterium]|nr:glycosyltransferase family 1 protein [Pseudomonadota bacterium]
MKRINLFYRPLPEADRWFAGDRHLRKLIRRIVRGKSNPSGLDKVFINLCSGLNLIGVNYTKNILYNEINEEDYVVVLGRGKTCLDGYRKKNKIVAGIGLMTHPSEWPTLCDEYPVSKYLQHSEWANNVYKPFFGSRCEVWPVGINTYEWSPKKQRQQKQNDFLIYNKIRWDYKNQSEILLKPILNILKEKNLSFQEIRYGKYSPYQFKKALRNSKAMIFLCEHESQGIAYQECLASDVPILAWDQGWCLDPNRKTWNQPEIPSSSVPYFSQECGIKFKNIKEFPEALNLFLFNLGHGLFYPRKYILENLTLEKSAQRFLEIVRSGI